MSRSTTYKKSVLNTNVETCGIFMMKNKNDDSALLLSEVQAPLEAITRGSGSVAASAAGRPPTLKTLVFALHLKQRWWLVIRRKVEKIASGLLITRKVCLLLFFDCWYSERMNRGIFQNGVGEATLPLPQALVCFHYLCDYSHVAKLCSVSSPKKPFNHLAKIQTSVQLTAWLDQNRNACRVMNISLM